MLSIHDAFHGRASGLIDRVKIIKMAESPAVPTREMLLDVESKLQALLSITKADSGPAGVLVTTCHSILPFTLNEKIHLEHARTLVTTHWSKGKFSIDPIRAYVERWTMKIDGKDWRVLCDEEGIIHSKHPNSIVSYMRWRQRNEDKLRLGDGGIFGDCVIINNKCGW